MQKYQEKNISKKKQKKKSTILTKNKLQIGKLVKSGSKSVTFLLVCKNLPGKANLKKPYLAIPNPALKNEVIQVKQNSAEDRGSRPNE